MSEKEKKMKQIPVCTVINGGIMPMRADNYSVGYDLFMPEDTIIRHGRQVIPMNVCLGLPKGLEAQIRPRSGFSSKGIEGTEVFTKFDLFINKFLDMLCLHRIPETKRFDADVLLGTIDHGYHDSIGVTIHNRDVPFMIRKGTRIAQMVFSEYNKVYFRVVEELKGYDRGGGFGHTGA